MKGLHFWGGGERGVGQLLLCLQYNADMNYLDMSNKYIVFTAFHLLFACSCDNPVLNMYSVAYKYCTRMPACSASASLQKLVYKA